MNLELFLAKRIYKGDKKDDKRVASPAMRIAITGIALGLMIMILAVCIVIGFKKEIRQKVIGFGSHIQITALGNSMNPSYEMQPIALSESLITQIRKNTQIKHIQKFITKPGIIKTDSAFQGVVLKGVGKSYDWTFFRKNLLEGKIIQSDDTSGINPAILSKNIADKLHLKLGDSFITYFVQEPMRARKFTITGIYRTNFEDYDKLYALTDLAILSKLNAWESDMVTGVEALVKDYNKLDETTRSLFFAMNRLQDRLGNRLYTRSIKDINPMIFNWLSLIDMNVWVILILMIAVSGFTMISGLLIIILERTQMIGILKALGTHDFNIRKTFLYLSGFIILRGMLWGNIAALILCFLQKQFDIMKLNPEVYYVSSVPVEINFFYILLINVGTLLVSMMMMIAPSYLVAKILPAKSIRFE